MYVFGESRIIIVTCSYSRARFTAYSVESVDVRDYNLLVQKRTVVFDFLSYSLRKEKLSRDDVLLLRVPVDKHLYSL